MVAINANGPEDAILVVRQNRRTGDESCQLDAWTWIDSRIFKNKSIGAGTFQRYFVGPIRCARPCPLIPKMPILESDSRGAILQP